MEFWAELHPIAVHFPIVLFSLYVVFEVLGIWKNNYTPTALIILFLGVISSIFAVLSGNQAEASVKSISENVAEIVEQHETFATLVVWYFLFILIGRVYFTVKKRLTKKVLILFSILAMIGAYFVYLAGHFGGELVYSFGIGTKLIE